MEFLGIGLPELLLIAVAALVILGPDRLPEAMSKMGHFIRQFRALTNGVTDQFARELQLEELRRQTSQVYDETRRATSAFSVPRTPTTPSLPVRSTEAFGGTEPPAALPAASDAEPPRSDTEPNRVPGGAAADVSQTVPPVKPPQPGG